MSFTIRIRPAVAKELQRARQLEIQDEAQFAFKHLERAHILGQASTREHLRAHWAMFCWGWRQGDWREMKGQVFRLVGAATKTFLGFVPAGNTGGSNVSPFRSMPIPADLQQQIDKARC